jgi:hypothetical protein
MSIEIVRYYLYVILGTKVDREALIHWIVLLLIEFVRTIAKICTKNLKVRWDSNCDFNHAHLI